jgi:type III pantothenate kinase
MNLVLDFGNTSAKIAVFQEESMLHKMTVKTADLEILESLFSEYRDITRAIISCVGSYSAEIYDYLKNILQICIELDKNTPLPVENLYETKDSLGYDRIAGVVGAASKYPGKNILVIDAGTAITYDFINALGQFLGGNISPGAHTRAKALNKFTARLPLVEFREDWSFPSKNTENAIISGILSGIVYEIDGYIDDLKKKYPDFQAILTGGDSKLFDKKLKNHIFVDSNLNLYGLNQILEYNAI